MMSVKLPPSTRITGQQSPFSPHTAGEYSSPMTKTRGPPLPMRWYFGFPVHDEQLLATKLQEAVMVGGSASILILGFGSVNVRRSQRGSAKKAGDSGREKLARTTAQDVSREPQLSDQSFATGSPRVGADLFESVRSLECAEGVRVKVVRSTALTRAAWTDSCGAPPC